MMVQEELTAGMVKYLISLIKVEVLREDAADSSILHRNL